MKYATSSHHAMIFNFNCYTYMLLRVGFEKLSDPAGDLDIGPARRETRPAAVPFRHGNRPGQARRRARMRWPL